MFLRELSEVILYVEDMAGQVRFYRDTLGLRVSYPPDVADFGGEYWVTFATGACTLALHRGGAKRFGEDAPKVVFRVDDVAAARTALELRGVKMDAVRSPSKGVLVSDGVDPEGNRFSIESR